MRHAVFAKDDQQWVLFNYSVVKKSPGNTYTRIEREYDLRGLRFEVVVLLDGAERSRLYLEAVLRRVPA